MIYQIESLEKLNIDYKVVKKRTNRIYAKYNNYGQLIITIPYGVKEDVVSSFITNNIEWVKKHYPTRIMPHLSYKDDDEYYFLGIKYNLKIVSSRHETVIKNENIITVYTSDPSNVGKLLDNFRLNSAETVFNEVLYRAFKTMEKDLSKYPDLKIKKIKSYWGQCHFKQNLIDLNISLINTPIICIEYVVYHELTHFLYPNHSADFHTYLKKYVPEEKKIRKMLKNYAPDYC